MLDVGECGDALRKTFSNYGGIDLLKAILSEQTSEGNDNKSNSSNLPWCVVFVDNAGTCLSK